MGWIRYIPFAIASGHKAKNDKQPDKHRPGCFFIAVGAFAIIIITFYFLSHAK